MKSDVCLRTAHQIRGLYFPRRRREIISAIRFQPLQVVQSKFNSRLQIVALTQIRRANDEMKADRVISPAHYRYLHRNDTKTQAVWQIYARQ